MSSSIQYLPIPPRVWSRVQNPCSVTAYKDTDSAANSDFAKADYERQMLLKGNILQYKKNSSSLTKKQRYTQIAKGMWTNRTKTWATQSDTYTNPNMTSLLRVNSSVVNPSNNIFSSPPNPFGCPTTVIPDGGNLVCNVVVDPCTQEVIKRTKSQQICNPTTDSDVPGRIQDLCWNDGTQTWYPRQRYVMPTSGSKWPQGYKGFVSAVTFVGPVLSVGNMTCGQINISLNWTFLDSTCAPITSFNIYQNGVLILNVLAPQTSVIINETSEGTAMFYITSLSNSIESQPSNTVLVSTKYNYSSEKGQPSNGGKTITFLENGSIIFFCDTNIKYTLVGGGASAGIYSQGSNGGSAAGGGGQVLNCSSPLLISSGTNLNIIIGQGGIAPNYEANGNIGEDTSINISGSYTVSTDNTTYGGVGGKGATNKSFSGGGGTLNPNNSDGGNYVISTNGIGFGSGGAAGSLTEVDSTGNIISVTKPLLGGNASNNSAGIGSNGFQGINGIYYGGGGGGGKQSSSSSSGGNGGLGGGGNGANVNGGLSTPTSNPNTGGGGGGGVTGFSPYYLLPTYLPASGGSGIAIIMIQ
jgi:hypothetical protein